MADESEYADDFEDQGYEDDFETKPTAKQTSTSSVSKQTVANHKQQPQKPVATAAKATAAKSTKPSLPASSKTVASTKPSTSASAAAPTSAATRPGSASSARVSAPAPATEQAGASTPVKRSPAVLRPTEGTGAPEEKRFPCKPAHLVSAEDLNSFLRRVGPATTHAVRATATAAGARQPAEHASFRIPVARPTETEYEQQIRSALSVQLPTTADGVVLPSGSGPLAGGLGGLSSPAPSAGALGTERKWGDAPTAVDTMLHLIGGRRPVACAQLNTGAYGAFCAIAYSPQPLPTTLTEAELAALGGEEQAQYVIEARVRTACLIVLLELRPGRADPSDPVLSSGSGGLSRCIPIPYRVCLCAETGITALEIQAAGGPRSTTQDACPAVLFASGDSGCVYSWVLSEPSNLHMTSIAWGVRKGLLKQKLGQPEVTKLQTPEILDPCTMLAWPSGLRFPSAYTTRTLLGRDGSGGGAGDDVTGSGGQAAERPGRRMSAIGGAARGTGKVQVEDGPVVRLQVLQPRGPSWPDIVRYASASASASASTPASMNTHEGAGFSSGGIAGDTSLAAGSSWKAGQGLSRLVTGSSPALLSSATASAGESASSRSSGSGSSGGSGGATIQVLAVHQSGRVDLWTFMHQPIPSGKGLESLIVSSSTSIGRSPLGSGRFVLTSSTPPPDPRSLPLSILTQPAPIAGADMAIPASERLMRARGGEEDGTSGMSGGVGGTGAGAAMVAGRGVRGIKALEAENMNRMLKRLALERLQIVCAAACTEPDLPGMQGAGGGRVGEGVLLGTQHGLVLHTAVTGGEGAAAGAKIMVYYHPHAGRSSAVALGGELAASGSGSGSGGGRESTDGSPEPEGGGTGVPCTALALNPCPVALGGKSTSLTYIFAAGFADGSLALYTLGRGLPLAHWCGPWGTPSPSPSPTKAPAEPVRAIASLGWRSSDPCILSVTDSSGGVCVWDWRVDTLVPVLAHPPPSLPPQVAAVSCSPEGDPAGLHGTGGVECMALVAHGEHLTCTPLLGQSPGPLLGPSPAQGAVKAARQWQQCVDAHWLPVMAFQYGT